MSNFFHTPSDEHSFSATTPGEWIERRLRRSPLGTRMRFCDIFRRLFTPTTSSRQIIQTTFLYSASKSCWRASNRLSKSQSATSLLPSRSLRSQKLTAFLSSPTLTHVERSTAMLRWCAICLDTLTNTARGARRLCYPFGIKQDIFGGGERFEGNINPSRWISSDQARRPLLHPSEIQRIATQLLLKLAHDPHLPGAVLAATTTFAAFALAGKTRVIFPQAVDWEVALLLPVGSAHWSSVEDDREETAHTVHL
ncbi:hypothetical protein BDV96DRAFT_606072 [Lophiotrema nucula]|uniref:Uncharacterized protein n=1 Tax=Lophiotrema nucula TaxID=690887 RepID=A0A6A5YM80_9PLEO|nr:hypothetical protein BDV96DRAFT_606072 [Lophiotrema nucula]